MYLFLAFFWLVVGVLMQFFWDALPRAYIPLDRTIVSFVCFVLFSFNFIRWRMARVRAQAYQDLNQARPPQPRRADPEIDPTFDFSDPKPEHKPPTKAD